MKALISTVMVLIALVSGYALHTTTTPKQGSFSPTGGGTYRLLSSVGTSDTSISLSSFKEPVSNIKYTMSYIGSDIQYGTLDPQTSKPEFVSFTGITQNSDGTAQLTGVTRGLSRTPAGQACAASTTLAQSHAAQSIFILSDSPCFFYEYLPARTRATSTAVLVFSSTTPPTYDANTTASGNQLVSFNQLQGVVLNGAATSTEAPTLGLVVISSGANTGAGTASTSAGVFGGAPIVIENKFATTTPGTLCTGSTWNCIVATTAGKIAQAFLDLTANFNFTGTTVYVKNLNASSTAANPLVLNGVSYNTPSTQGASSTVMINDGSGNLSFQIPPALALLSSTTTTQAMLYATSTFSAVRDLHITLYMPTLTQISPCMTFNQDAGSNYGDINFSNYATPLVDTTKGLIIGWGNNSTSTDAFYTIDIKNVAAKRKIVQWTGSLTNSTTNYPNVFNGSGVWNNTSAQITSIAFTAGSGSICTPNNIPSGTVINVYGY